MESAQSLPSHETVRVTPSKIDTWQECSRRFARGERSKNSRQFQYSTKLATGKAVHELFARTNQLVLGGGAFPDISETIDRFWNASHFRTPEEAFEAKADAGSMLANHFDRLLHKRLTIVGYERFIATRPLRVNDRLLLVLSGKIDAIEDDGADTIIGQDYKTGEKLPTREELSQNLSTTVYHLLLRQLHPRASKIVIAQHLLSTGAVVSVSLTEEQVNVSKDEIRKFAIALAEDPLMIGTSFQPTLCESCSWCPYRDSCPLHVTEVTENLPF